MRLSDQAVSSYLSGDYKKSIELYRIAITSESGVSVSSCLYNIGVCYMRLKDYSEALEYTGKALELRKDAKYYFNMGYCYAMLEQKSNAIRYFKIALNLDPDDIDARKALAFLNKNGFQESVKEFKDINFTDLFPVKKYLKELMGYLNIALEEGNKEMFMCLSHEYNIIKKEL